MIVAIRKLSKLFFAAALLAVTGFGIACSASAQASPKPSAVKPTRTLTLHLDAEQTKVEWTVGVTLHKAHGTFKMNGGELIADPKTGVAQGEIEIDTGSLSTGDEKRDAKWKQDVLDSGRYPAIIFHPVSVEGLKEGDGDQTVKARGTVTLHGTDHPVEMELHLQVSGRQAMLMTHFVIPMCNGIEEPQFRIDALRQGSGGRHYRQGDAGGEVSDRRSAAARQLLILCRLRRGVPKGETYRDSCWIACQT